MGYSEVRFRQDGYKVRDYATWKPLFDDHAVERKSVGGAVETHVFRSIDDPNEVFVLIKGTDDEKARQFLESRELRKAMGEAGVSDRPDVHFIELADTTDG